MKSSKHPPLVVGQRVTAAAANKCPVMSGVLAGISGDGKTLLVRFDGNSYHSNVDANQVENETPV